MSNPEDTIGLKPPEHLKEKILRIVEWKYNVAMARLEFALSDGSDLYISDIVLEEIFHSVPAISEAEKIRALLDKIHQLRKNRILEIKAIDKQVEELRKQHEQVRKDLANAPDKLTVWKHNAQIKSLVAEKQMLDTRRHLCKLTYQEQGELEAILAKLERGKK